MGIALAAGLAGCAAQPQKTLETLNSADPKFASADCVSMRNIALTYDDKVGQRVAIGLATGLLLGPFGVPIAASVDAAQDKEREAMNREITLRCITGGEAIIAARDEERRKAQIEAQEQRDTGADR